MSSLPSRTRASRGISVRDLLSYLTNTSLVLGLGGGVHEIVAGPPWTFGGLVNLGPDELPRLLRSRRDAGRFPPGSRVEPSRPLGPLPADLRAT